MKKHIVLLVISILIFSGFVFHHKKHSSLNETSMIKSNPSTNDELVKGLKEALSVGTKNAVSKLGKTDGFFKDPLVKIPFPPDVKYVADKLKQIGMGQLVDNFILQINRSAENAMVKASPIFINAISTMNFSDALGILKGPDNAATTYFKNKTSNAVFIAFKPQIQGVLNTMQVTKSWTNITSTYNKIPFTKKIETDLPKYVTNKAMDGLFKKIENEEKAIRKNPAARVTDILKKVFGPK
jgi:hypothetical protein